MPPRARLYIGSILLAEALLAGVTILHVTASRGDLVTFAALTFLAIVAQLFKAEAPNHVLLYASPVFFFAGLLLLPPFLTVLLVAIPHLVEWARERWRGSPHLKAWYLQPFNIAMYTIALLFARWIYAVLDVQPAQLLTPTPVAVGVAAAIMYVTVNHVLLGLALVLARGVSWRDSGVLDIPGILTEVILAAVGLTVAVLWRINPWFTLPALAPLILMYQALMIPQLKQDAQVDSKTGLFNARHFNVLFTAELDRARRFDRPLSFIMADLDFLRDINNTYGHLAGDVVLAGIGQIIRHMIREYDVAGRFGGEEFSLVVPESEPGDAEILAERVRQGVEAAQFDVATSTSPIRVTMSLGVASYPQDATSTTDLIHAADVAVYQAKAAGRNRVVSASTVSPEVWAQQAAAAGRMLSGSPATSEAVRTAAAQPPAVPLPRQETPAGSAGQWTLWLFIACVIAAALAATGVGVRWDVPGAPAVIGLLAALAVIAELLQVDLYGRGAVSVSMSLTFAAALLTGVPGVAVVSAAIALAHHIRQGRRIVQIGRAAFNWGTHILAGLAPVLLVRDQGVPVRTHSLLELALPTVLAGLAYYAIETGLIATAISLTDGTSPLATWRAQYRCLVGHYLALCLMGLVVAIAYSGLDMLGILVFTLPIFMMHYVQKQYITQTKESVRALQRLNRDLSRAALTDSLTGLGNSRGLQLELQREYARAVRHGEDVSLARINVDEFKAINDQHGNLYGDQVLASLATILQSGRAADRAFRLNSDEFALLLPHTSLTDAVTLAERLRKDSEAGLSDVTISIGVSALPSGLRDADLLMRQANAALAEAKRRGRNTVVTFEEVRDSIAITSSAQSSAVHRLLIEGDLSIAFQPIWDLNHGGILAFEALARPAARYGLTGPQEAFDIAERMGRSHDLDAVCRHAILARAGELPDDALLFVNVSPQTLDHDLLAGNALVDAVRAAGLTPDRVVLELTERSMARLAVVVREATRLRALGFKLALDDTGAGNAGLEMLSQLPVDFLKVDKSVVIGALTNRAARAVLAGIIAIARETDTYVIAEGIETAAMLDMVAQVSAPETPSLAGIHGVQGYLIGRPASSIPGEASMEALKAVIRSAQGQMNVMQIGQADPLARVRKLLSYSDETRSA